MSKEVIIPQSCLVCGTAIPAITVSFCRACKFPCELTVSGLGGDPVPEGLPDGTMMVLDFKSKCCGADVDIYPKATCSAECHEMFVARCERDFGTHKKIISLATGKAHQVPTRLIVERGIKAEDLPKFPLWPDP